MSEHHERYPRTTLEDRADGLLSLGYPEDAKILLDEFAREAYTNSTAEPHAFFRALLKAHTVPLYTLAYYRLEGTGLDTTLQQANETYDIVGQLIDHGLGDSSSIPYDEYNDRIGELSELTVLGLFVRTAIDETTTHVPVLSSRQKDLHGGVDFYFTPVGTGRVDDGRPIQVKTVATKEHIRRYREKDPDIIVVSMGQLDEHAQRPHNPESLAQRMLRELNGTASDDDVDALTVASRKLHKIVNKRRKIRLDTFSHVTRTFFANADNL